MITSPDRLLLLAGDSSEELRHRIAADPSDLLARNDLLSPQPTGRCRLALVNADAQRLALAKRILDGGTAWRGRKDIWFTPSPLIDGQEGRVAVVFPGLEQRFEPVLDDVAAHFDLSQPESIDEQRSVRQHSIALLSAGKLLDAALRRIGVRPAAVAGHSIGEWNAMMSAGIFTPEGIDRYIEGAGPGVFELPNCMYAALGCGVDVAAAIIADLDGIVISHDNCPHQSILCGERDAITIAVSRLSERGISARVLSFQSGFHSPFLIPYLDWVRKVADLPIEAASTPVWSATIAQPFPADEQTIRELTVRHLLEPVRFRELIDNMYASGIRVFIQAGVGSVTAFIDDTLAGREYLAISANAAGQPGMRQLLRTAAALWVEGAPLRFDQLATREMFAAAVPDQVVA
ncbi:acyl transferase domain-containing protein [Silvibacterium bohemicum]|uniref:Acyl transferase domain-containing protein n=1 Tax=Silvibacterium bohemicum TaxID=1577686 RepID=A0A841JT71_9BACT|nr:acyltransferase domain-containing protein [Silvibacterium bohemicum]MBB6144526.1 acyl transferase domain-containing protein [Silvibacterium bohemicum]